METWITVFNKDKQICDLKIKPSVGEFITPDDGASWYEVIEILHVVTKYSNQQVSVMVKKSKNR